MDCIVGARNAIGPSSPFLRLIQSGQGFLNSLIAIMKMIEEAKNNIGHAYLVNDPKPLMPKKMAPARKNKE